MGACPKVLLLGDSHTQIHDPAAALCPTAISKPTKYRRRDVHASGSLPTSLQLRKWWEPVSSAQD